MAQSVTGQEMKHDDSHSKCYTDLCSEYEPDAALVEAEWGKDPTKSKERKRTT